MLAIVIFVAGSILLVAAVVLSACLKEVPLRLVSGNQARAQASEPAGSADRTESPRSVQENQDLYTERTGVTASAEG